MEKPVIAIAEEFDKYTSLVFHDKVTFDKVIRFSRDKPSRKDTLYYEKHIEHRTLSDEMQLLAEQKRLDHNFYKFQLRCPAFCEKPIFRFDSDGSAHQNKGALLKEQQVPTPHFNKYDEKGRGTAYQTEKLKGVKYEDLQRIGEFFTLFCDECSLRFIDGSYPSIESGDTRILQLPVQSDDLLAGIKFPL